ncbi:Rv2175c family DNA-binding protein [Actinotalea sp. K2]|uniref:Rv2175c family DNA-binding protein n=1 Tax=Actinotalea sp. K2 TaxID=2939438 RepID=UPI002016D410|nr:Rv2175c family DNA-binding protein [Actinotalea sp. K2]MCL3862178.1 Rv2175c family DNA-binding protein [Actinotalea sp. K2]
MTELDALVPEWLPLPDVADLLGTDVGRVRRLLQESRLLAVRVGERRILSVPRAFLMPGTDGNHQVIPSLQGTIQLLMDAGFAPEEAITWLFTPDDSLLSLGTGETRPGTPVEALQAGHKTEIRRRAQALAL